MEVSLNHLQPGMEAQVVSVCACGPLGKRLRQYGIEPGTWLHCTGKSQNGQATSLQLDGSSLWLQTRDLEKIRVSVRQP